MTALEIYQMRMRYQSYLCHHGIKGQKWGQRNGPPYPLADSKHSASERKAGWKKSLTKGSGKTDNKARRRSSVVGSKLSGSPPGRAGYSSDGAESAFTGSSKGIRRLARPESLAETLQKANPLRDNPLGDNNCVLSAIAGFLRQAGYDVTAKGTPGRRPLNMGGVVEECFKGVKVLDGFAVKFGRSREDAAQMLLKRYGSDAQGVCGIDWKGGGGHTFSWKITNGVVSFFDCQQGKADDFVSRVYFNMIDPTGNLTLARLDGLEIDVEAISKYIN